MMFFETSAKKMTNINMMMFTGIAQLPFFSQFDIDKDELIKELQSLNSKGGNIVEEKNEDLKVRGEDNNIQKTKIIIKAKKKSCGC